MKKKLYIIPGWKETTRRRCYQVLAKNALYKGYQVVKINPDWKKPLSTQIFPVKKESVIFGFSLGAVLAHLVARKYPCKRVLLASMTPFEYLKDKDWNNYLGKNIAKDLAKIKFVPLECLTIEFYGALEGEGKGIVVPATGHELNSLYISTILEYL